MATHIGIGFSQNANGEIAAKEAAFSAKSNMEANRIDLAIVFSSIHYSPKKITPILNKILNNAKIVGSSTAGIILPDAVQTRGIGVLTICSDEMKFATGFTDDINELNSHQAAISFSQNCINNLEGHQRQAMVLLIDGLLKSNSEFLRGLQEVFGNVFPIVGAGSCDDFHFNRSFQIYNNQFSDHSACGFVMGGSITVGIGGRHGWRPLGKPRFISRARNNCLHSIDGKKASHMLEEYFGDDTEVMSHNHLGKLATLYPLGVKIEGSREYLLRNAVGLLEDGSILCQGDIPEGEEVHIMIGNKDACYLSAAEAAREAKKNLLGKEPKMVIILESLTRLKLLGRSAYKEIVQIKDVFGLHVPVFGMYSNGEIYPVAIEEKYKKIHYQNASIIILAVS